MIDSKIYTKLQFLPPRLKQEVYDYVDFLLNREKKKGKKNKPQFGCAKGRFKMSSDFDEPLDDFKEYMQ